MPNELPTDRLPTIEETRAMHERAVRARKKKKLQKTLATAGLVLLALALAAALALFAREKLQTLDKPLDAKTAQTQPVPQELADKLELLVLPLHFTIGGKTYANYLDGREIGFHDFFERIRQGEAASTSAVNPESFREVMEQTLQQGLDILFVGFSSGLSTTYQSGCIAADDLREKYPERKILTVDSLCASLGQGLYVYLGALQQQAGKSIEEVRDYLEDIKLHLCHWFTVDDLMYLKRGGRISATTAVLGTVMQIKPVMHMDNDGHLANVTKARGRKGSLIALAEKALTTSTDLPSQTMFICHGDCYDDAKFVADYIRERSKVQDVIINYVGPVIGSHTGPGVVSVFFLGTER